MALFGSKKSNPSFMKKVRPTVVKTQNVAKELVTLAKSYDVRVDSLDFSILEAQTFVRENSETAEGEWEEVSSEELYGLDKEKTLLNPNFQIKQVYEIEIFSKNGVEDFYKDFNVEVGVNATKCKAYLSIKQGSVVNYSNSFEKDLLVIINKRKIRAGILINIFDEMLDVTISQIVARVRVDETVKYEKNEMILIAQSLEPTATTDNKIIFHYAKEEKVKENAKVDYASRGFIHSVVQDELIIEYVKPKEGKPGRNCRGEFIAPKRPK